MKNILTILLLFVFSGLSAADYFVSNSGSDAAAGTSTGTAWQTINKLNTETFSPGDNIYFNRGDVWREQLNIISSGSSGNPITFGAYGTGAKPIINGANVTTGWTTVGSNQWSVNNPNASTSRAMVIIDGVIYSEVASLAACNSANEYFIDLTATPDKLYVFSTVDPDGLTAEISTRDFCAWGGDANNVQYVDFENIEFRYAGHSGIALFGTDGGQTVGGCVVDGCTFYANRFFGVVAYDGHSDNTFKNSTATYNGNGFYTWQSDNTTIQNCSTANNIRHVVGGNATDGHGYGCFNANNFLAENNVSDGDAGGVIVDQNGEDNDAIVRYNYFYNSQDPDPGIAVANTGAGSIVQVYYNLIVNCGGPGGNGFDCYIVNAGTVNVYNNTIYAAAGYSGNGIVFLRYGDGFVFKNNVIVIEYVEFAATYFIQDPALSTSDYNQYYILDNVSGTVRMHYDGTTYTTLAAWQSATSQDANSISSDPLFVNEASDWSLQSGSPVINVGTSVGLTQDILGNPIVGNPDMGAYEFQPDPPSGIILKGRRIVIQ